MIVRRRFPAKHFSVHRVRLHMSLLRILVKAPFYFAESLYTFGCNYYDVAKQNNLAFLD